MSSELRNLPLRQKTLGRIEAWGQITWYLEYLQLQHSVSYLHRGLAHQ